MSCSGPHIEVSSQRYSPQDTSGPGRHQEALRGNWGLHRWASCHLPAGTALRRLSDYRNHHSSQCGPDRQHPCRLRAVGDAESQPHPELPGLGLPVNETRHPRARWGQRSPAGSHTPKDQSDSICHAKPMTTRGDRTCHSTVW